MKSRVFLLFALIAIATTAMRVWEMYRAGRLSQAVPVTIPRDSPLSRNRVGPDTLYPRAALTPGKSETLDRAELVRRYPCPPTISGRSCTYSQSHRDRAAVDFRRVYDLYDVPRHHRNAEFGQVDHLNPVCNGGSHDIANLWYQRAINPWNGGNYGYREKDQLETWICAQIKAGVLDPAAAYHRVTTDWVAFYKDLQREDNF